MSKCVRLHEVFQLPAMNFPFSGKFIAASEDVILCDVDI